MHPEIPAAVTVAFKEWASVCLAIRQGRQTVLYRKGGIADTDGLFQPEHSWFWLFPTLLHQQPDGIHAAEQAFFPGEVITPNTVPIQTLVHVVNLQRVSQWEELARWQHRHIWSEAAVRKKFEYRQPGVYVLEIQAYALPAAVMIAQNPVYDGCKTWVPLEETIPLPVIKPSA